MAVRDIVEDDHCHRTEKHDVNSEHKALRSSGIARNTHRIRDELADGSKIRAGEHEIIHGEVSEGSKVETR